MEYNSMNQYQQAEGYQQETLSRYTAKTFLWMFAGLLVTFGAAVATYTSGMVWYIFSIPYAVFILAAVELLVVIGMTARIHKISVGTARGMFLFYAALNGIVFSAYFLLFHLTALIFVFAATSLFFGLMAVVAYVTKIDLSGIRPILIGGVLFLAVFHILSMFLNLTAMETGICYIGIILFLALTAYDVGMIRKNYQYYAGNGEMLAKASIFSALELYLDFINLFLYLLRLLGKAKN